MSIRFGTDGWRAVISETFTFANLRLVAQAIADYILEETDGGDVPEVVVGHDTRFLSDRYAAEVARVMAGNGIVAWLTRADAPTPAISYSVVEKKAAAGIMITASHNPPEYNGFKLCLGLDSIHGEDIQKILHIISDQAFSQGQGTLSSEDVVPAYTDSVVNNISLEKPLKVGVDAGNGTGGFVAVPILKKLGCVVHDIYCDMDGTFPNHEADPTVGENMQDLIALVKEKDLDIGVGFDGDGDRIGVVDESGRLIFGDKLMIIYAREILSRKPGATFISEVKCSKTMYDDIEKHGGRAIMWRTGHSLIKKKMKEERAALAGEMSGHMFFADRYYGFDDATYAACRLLEILAKTGKTISELLSDVPETVTTPEIRVECPDDIKFDLVKKITAHFRKQYNVIDIDGARVVFDDGWGLVRASNTQPALVLRFEAMTIERLNEIRHLIESTLEEFKNAS